MDVDFIALDLETANHKRSSICEIGLSIVESGRLTESKSWLIKPPKNDYHNFFISIHGITPENTVNQPTFPEVWEEIRPILDNQIVVTHNTSFDMFAIKDALDFYGMEYPEFEYYCSLRISQLVFPGLKSYSLPYLCKALNIDFGKHHRAGGDAKGCAEVFLKNIKKLGVNKISEIDEILKICKGHFNVNEHMPLQQIGYFSSDEIADPIDILISKIDKNNYFAGKGICFTGDFKFINRKNLLQLIEDIGGYPLNNVSKKTDILVVGQQNLMIVGESGISSKQRKAMKLIEQGHNLEIMSESEFFSFFV